MFVNAIEQSALSEEVSLESLRRDYLHEVFRFASRRLGRDDAEDATAETFQVAFNSIHRIKGTDPRLWLLGIARRKVADQLRRAGRRREIELREQVPYPLGKTIEQAEADAEVRKIVMSLPKDQRDALLLQHLECLSVAEIAIVMGKTESSVTSLLHRARLGAFRKGKNYFLDVEVTK